MVRYVGFSSVARVNVRGNAPQQALVALDVTGIMSTFTRKFKRDNNRGTYQPEILLFCELSLFFTRKYASALGEVFVSWYISSGSPRETLIRLGTIRIVGTPTDGQKAGLTR